MPPKNPWTNISWQNTIANCDRCCVAPFLVGMGKRIAHQLHNELLPEPFHGDLNADVYLLNGNPGFSIDDYKILGDKTIESHVKDTLLQKSTTTHVPVMWLVSTFAGFPAFDWWHKRLKDVLLNNTNPKMCIIEYIPYHSKELPSLPPLPSDVFVDWWIRDAISTGKWIIIMRCKRKWFERLPQLATYPKLLVCTNPRNPAICQNNLIEFTTGNLLSSTNWNNILKLL